MIAAGVPVTSVQKMLGHASIRTTQLYVQVADTQVEQDYHAGIQKVIEKLSTLPEVSQWVRTTMTTLITWTLESAHPVDMHLQPGQCQMIFKPGSRWILLALPEGLNEVARMVTAHRCVAFCV